MARSSVAEARRSQLVSTYGIGALFPAEDESFMLVGLDDWEERYCPEVSQPRLARSLGVRTFRMPPSRGRRGEGRAGRPVPADAPLCLVPATRLSEQVLRVGRARHATTASAR